MEVSEDQLTIIDERKTFKDVEISRKKYSTIIDKNAPLEVSEEKLQFFKLNHDTMEISREELKVFEIKRDDPFSDEQLKKLKVAEKIKAQLEINRKWDNEIKNTVMSKPYIHKDFEQVFI